MQVNSEGGDSRFKDVAMLLSRLMESTNRLRILARFCALITLCNFLMTMFSGLVASSRSEVRSDFVAQVGIMGFFVALGALFFLYLFDQGRKLGDAVFQELSDELEWSPYQKSATNKFAISRPAGIADVPRATVRLSVREFLLASTLPLVEREGSVRIYLLVNIACSIAVVVLLTLATKV
jgi:hypothetical protein